MAPIGQALTGLLDPEQVAQSFASSGLTGSEFVLHLTLDTGELDELLRECWGEAYVAGYHAGDLMLASAGVTASPPPWDNTVAAAAAVPPDTTVDWSAWTPGSNATAAQLVADDQSSGLAALLHKAGIVIDGIQASTLDDLSNLLADSANVGDSVAQAAKRIGDLIGDPARVTRIANTELARAMTSATLETYATNGVRQKEWILSDGACDLCVECSDDGPVDIGDEFTNGDPPVHPGCVCAVGPVVGE